MLRALQIALHLSATWLVLDFVNICCLCVAVAFVQTHTCITQCPFVVMEAYLQSTYQWYYHILIIISHNIVTVIITTIIFN